jgi:predicted transcriptional regulator
VTKHPDRPESGRDLRPSKEASRISEALAQAPSNRPEPGLLAAVEWVSHLRSLRTSYLPPHLLGEPAWDMLLELLRAELVSEPMTPAQLSIAAGLPLGITNRWVNALVQSGLCSEAGGADEGQVRLTPQGTAVLRDYFLQLPDAFSHRP